VNRAEREALAADLRTWALAYAAHGWPVFPLAPGTKVPALPRRLGGRGCLDATTDAEIVAEMWKKYPLGNVGIATGEAAGLAVLDVDPRHGGELALAALVKLHGPIPAGPVARTPSGGCTTSSNGGRAWPAQRVSSATASTSGPMAGTWPPRPR
jgi:hypothetical protein